MAAGCTGTSENNPADDGGSAQEEAAVQEKDEEEAETRNEEFDFEELTVLDTEVCTVKITAVGMEEDEYSGGRNVHDDCQYGKQICRSEL